MSPLRIGSVILLAAGISIGVAVVGQRWIESPAPENPTSARPAAPLQSLPELGLTDLAGQGVDGTAWEGKVVILNFWATWCPPCIREIPLFVRVQDALRDAGVQVVGVAVDRRDDVRDFVARYPVNYPILIATPEAVSLSKRLGNRVEGLPFTVIFDRRGRRVFSRTGEVTAELLRSELDALVRPQDRVALDGVRM